MVVVILAFVAAASAISQSNVYFIKDGTNVAYSINHEPTPDGPNAFVSVTRDPAALAAAGLPPVNTPLGPLAGGPLAAGPPVAGPLAPALQTPAGLPVPSNLGPLSPGHPLRVPGHLAGHRFPYSHPFAHVAPHYGFPHSPLRPFHHVSGSPYHHPLHPAGLRRPISPLGLPYPFNYPHPYNYGGRYPYYLP